MQVEEIFTVHWILKIHYNIKVIQKLAEVGCFFMDSCSLNIFFR